MRTRQHKVRVAPPGRVVTPGGSANVSLATRAVNVTLSTSGGLAKNGQTVVAVHPGTTGCGPVTYNGATVGQVLTCR